MTNNRRDLLITLNSFWVVGKGMSGGDQIAKQVFTRIGDSFSRILVLTSKAGFELFKDLPHTHHLKPSNFTESRGLGLAYFFRTVEGIIKIMRIKVDVIYTGSDFFTDVIPSYVYKSKFPHVLWYQSVFHIYPDWKKRPGSKVRAFLGYYLQKMSFELIKKADNVICINTQVRSELVVRGINEKNLVLIYPGINLEVATNTLPGIKTYDAAFLARLNPSKGILDLVKIWSLVCKEIPNAKLAVIGSGSVEVNTGLKKELVERGLSANVELLGYLEDSQAYGTIKSSCVFIFPSHEEGFGIAVAEAMACGVPIVAWDLKVYDEIFENKIIKVKENDTASFADEVLKVLKDQQLHDKMAGEGLEYIKKYSWDNVARQYLSCLTQN